MNDELLGRFIRFESYGFRVGHWVVLFIGCIACMVEQVGSIDRLLAGVRRAGESPLFGLVEVPFIVDVLAILVVVALFIAFVAWALNPTRGAGLIGYTPCRYAVSVAVFASIMLFGMVSKGKVDMAEFTPYFATFAISTIFPIMLLFNSTRGKLF
jgi:hypothetical protein